MKLILSLLAVAALTGCGQRAASNAQVLTTSDCGATWTKLQTGEKVPRAIAACEFNTAIPDWPMAGDAQFTTQFSGQVLAKAKWSYTYAITDPIAFINEARYLGRMGGSLEISAEAAGSRFEMAENLIIDRNLREVTTELTRDLAITTANPAEIEEAVQKKTHALLLKKGVTLTDLALVIDNDTQTRLAIDVVTAMRVYEAAGIKVIGAAVVAARAGAAQVELSTLKKD